MKNLFLIVIDIREADLYSSIFLKPFPNGIVFPSIELLVKTTMRLRASTVISITKLSANYLC